MRAGTKVETTSAVCPRCGGSGRVSSDGITVADRLRAGRIRLGQTQSEFATTLRISRSQLMNLEVGRHQPGLNTLMHAADALCVSMDYLLGREEPKPAAAAAKPVLRLKLRGLNPPSLPAEPEPGTDPEKVWKTKRSSKAGYARAANLKPERRSEIARQGAAARWSNKAL